MADEIDMEDVLKELQYIDEKLYGKIKNMHRFPLVFKEEMDELFAAPDRINEIEEFGDVMFCLASYARVRNIDIKQAVLISAVKMRERLKLKNKANANDTSGTKRSGTEGTGPQ